MLYLITPTGGRPDGMAMLGQYLRAQSGTMAAIWVIVDDCDPMTHIPTPPPGVTVHLVRPSWRWQPGQNTQARSMLAALEVVPDDGTVLILEDDDAYMPGHVQALLGALDDADLVGERSARYYNVATRRWKEMPGLRHSSLAATGCKGEALAMLHLVCERSPKFIDLALWRGYKGRKKLLDTANVVGIKGLPGRGGIGVGHRPTFGRPDTTGILAKWLGPERAEAYERFGRPARHVARRAG